MTWQEPIVALIVAAAVVSLYKHLRAMVCGADAGSEPSCHGCEECDRSTAPVASERKEKRFR